MEILNIYPNPERSEWAALTERCTRREEEITRQVASILDEVRTGGDRALRDITRRIEGRDCETFEVPADVRRAAAALIPAKPVPSPAPIPAKNVTIIVIKSSIEYLLSE